MYHITKTVPPFTLPCPHDFHTISWHLSDDENEETVEYYSKGSGWSKDDKLDPNNPIPELEQIFPSLVEEDENGIKGVKYSVFVPIIIKALQELKQEFDLYKIEHP